MSLVDIESQRKIRSDTCILNLLHNVCAERTFGKLE